MLETDPSFRPVRAHDGYPPLEDLGLIGDGTTVALVGLDGGILAVPSPLRLRTGLLRPAGHRTRRPVHDHPGRADRGPPLVRA